jgi:folate-binding protein YgfZ
VEFRDPESVVTLGTLRVHGRDAAGFLQGQLSNDVQALADGAQQLAGYHTPQGRVIALLRLTRLGPEELLAQLPAELGDAVAQRLRRFVLRARVTIEVLDAAAAAAAASAAAAAAATAPAASIAGWNATRSRSADIAAGLPQVYAATSEKFVAQMLNLDCIGAVSFSKGCYTGQEVIARAHYRGRVKRRMQRFATRAPLAAPLRPGDTLRLADARRLEVIDAVSLADGRVEFLAVGPLPGGTEESPPQPPAATAPATAAAPAAATPTTADDAPPLIDCEPLPLPYALPD